MGLFSRELANVIEWKEEREGILFWKWQNQEIKKGSKLIIRPGQDAVFWFKGGVEVFFRGVAVVFFIFISTILVKLKMLVCISWGV